MPRIDTAKIAIFATNGFEQSELIGPRDQLTEAGAHVTVASLDGQPIRAWDEDDWGKTVEAQARIADIDPAAFDALVLPGGQINPDILRADDDTVARIRAFADAGKPVAAICHAPWLLIEAGLVSGKRLTSYPSIRTDLRNAGAEVVDETVARDGNLITSRNPGDIDAFVEAIIAAVTGADSGKRAA